MPNWSEALADRVLAGGGLTDDEARRILLDGEVDVLSLVHAAYRVRRSVWGKGVQIHIINNAQNGHCPEDCSYCSQAKTSATDIEAYPIKSEDEVLAEAKAAYEAGAHRYCMVFAGRGPNARRTETLAALVRKIKQTYNIEVCVSAGLLDDDKARVLAEAGVDRYNHNLNTSREHYGKICTTHTFDDRLNTVRAARRSGLEVCSGLIVGMGETSDEIIEIARELQNLDAQSIPVNFLLPFEGAPLGRPQTLTPEYCLRVLCMFRFMCPRAEVRISAGREYHLRSLQALALYPANSLFLEGYLNSTGSKARETLQMIRDAGFEIVSDQDLDALLAEDASATDPSLIQIGRGLKSRKELRPALS